MHLVKFPRPNGISKLGLEFPSRSLCKSEESRARIAVDHGNRSSQLAEGHLQHKINYAQRFLWLWRIGFDDGGRIETISIRTAKRGSASKSRELKRTTDFSEGVRLRIWSTKLQSVEPGKILAPSGRLENVFSGRQLSLGQEETLVVFYTRMPRETVRQRGTKWEDARRSRLEQASSSVTKSEGTDWREKLKQSRGQSCDWS